MTAKIKPMPGLFKIEFDYLIDGIPKAIHLYAEVEGVSELTYIVSDIKSNNKNQVLPLQKIKKVNNQWVHLDSERETALSQAIGKGIESA
jgi:hypothetical protein